MHSRRLAPASRRGYVKKELLVQGDVDLLPWHLLHYYH